MKVELSRRDELTLDLAWRVGFRGAGLVLTEEARTQIINGRNAFNRLLKDKPDQMIYGTTTGPGSRGKVQLDLEARFQQGDTLACYMPLGVSAGGRCLPQRTCRIIALARFSNIIGGQSKIGIDIAEALAAMLSEELPCIPFDSATGPGEVLPISHLLKPIAHCRLLPGEAMALINGSPCATGMVAETALTAQRRLNLALKVFALSIAAAGIPYEHFSPRLKEVSADPDYHLALDRLNALIANAPEVRCSIGQAPVSWRVLPYVLATAIHAVDWAGATASYALTSVADNPVYLLPDDDHPHGETLSTGGFHNHQAGRAIDGVNAIWSDLSALASKHVARLLDGANIGLPPLLVPRGSNLVGMEMLAWMQQSHAEKGRRAAAPSVLPLGLEDPQGGQQDVASTAFIAYERHLNACDAFDASLATLAFASAQALKLTNRSPPPGVRDLYNHVLATIPAVNRASMQDLGESLMELRYAFSNGVTLNNRETAYLMDD
ncbi:MAG: aromatic amino acid lyase [Pseudomonadota bacterium]